MVSAASRAAKTLGGSSRNRPSRSMSMNSGNTNSMRSSTNSGLDGSGGDYSGDPSGGGGNSSNHNNQPSSGGGGGGGPLFMNDVQAQYESLSERLARENNNNNNNNAPSASSLGESTNDKSKSSKSRKVRWAQTAAMASTMDANNARDDGDYVPRSPAEILSDLFAKKYTLPVFLVVTSFIFLMVHFAGGPNDDSFRRYGSPDQGGMEVQGGKRSGPNRFGGNRQQNVGGGDGFGEVIFSLIPTHSDSSMIPTSSVIHHNTPKISPNAPGGKPGASRNGNEPSWIVVPTSSRAFAITSDADGGPGGTGTNGGGGGPGGTETNGDAGGETTLKWNYGAGVPTPNPALLNQGNNGGSGGAGGVGGVGGYAPGSGPGGVGGYASGIGPSGGRGGPDDGSPTTLKWNLGFGVPTPNPALLKDVDPDKGSPTTLKWNFGVGVPTPDPALLKDVDPDKGSPTTLVWNYPDGVPTPNPALLVEVSPPSDDGSPTTLKWGGLQQKKPVSTPHGPHPPHTPHTAIGLHTAGPRPPSWVRPPSDPDAGSPTTLKWDFPPGEPTPDPALLKGIPDAMVWGYPPGIPTPDPMLLQSSSTAFELSWGYPDGVPTPDPMYLVGSEVRDPVGWGYPPGEPTPDPMYLNGAAPGTEAPTKRNVETGMVMLTPKPTPKPTPSPALEPVTEAPALTLKLNMAPEVPRPPPADNGPRPPPGPPSTGRPTPTPIDPIDQYGNGVELAPGDPTPRPVRDPRPDRPDRPDREPNPVPKAYTAPYGGPDIPAFQNARPGNNPDWNDPFWSGPNGLTIWQDPQPQRPDREPKPGVQPYEDPEVIQTPQYFPMPGGMVIPQTQSCGCCCCQCGGGGGGMYTPNFVVPQAYLPQIAQNYQGGFLPMMQLPPGVQMGGQGMQYQPVQMYGGVMGGSLAPSAAAPGCAWECLIDETVVTQGRSNEDDAIYEVFYTNPLNCCGTIVEVGAGDGVEFSTSYFFEKGMNWTTILTEADPVSYAKIGDNRNGTKVRAVNGAFCQDAQYLHFDEEQRAFQSPMADDYSSELLLKGDDMFKTTNSSTKIDCIRLDDMLIGIDHINVMIVHVKGDPWAAVKTMNWNIQVDIWVILMEQRDGLSHHTINSALRLHDYVPAAWDIKLWCDTPSNCKDNAVWLRRNFHPLHQPKGFLRGS